MDFIINISMVINIMNVDIVDKIYIKNVDIYK